MKRRILFLVNHEVVIYNFRLELVVRLLKDGYQVLISSPYGERIKELEELGCISIHTTMDRHGVSILRDMKLLMHYRKILKQYSPSVVLTYTIKPNIYGGVACRMQKIPYIANITGLGTAVENAGFLQSFTSFLYKHALRNAQKVFFQNKENQAFFEKKRIALGKYGLLTGSGVNLEKYSFVKYPNEDGTVRLVFIGRIMTDKGIKELLEAVNQVHAKHPFFTCDIVGFFEGNTHKTAVESFCSLGAGKYLGVSDEVHEMMSNYHAVVLPSYHEGMSNILLEAAATGRPVLASNIPGCRETFDEGFSGFGFEPRSVHSLVEAIERFIVLSHEKKAAMGLAGRKKMEQEFDRQIVVDAYMREIEYKLEVNEKKDKKK